MNIDDLKHEIFNLESIKLDAQPKEVVDIALDHLHAQGYMTPADEVKALRDAVRDLNEYARMNGAVKTLNKHADTIRKCEEQK
jgi:hypothetical protein